ncbi:MAG: hypothetical protein GY720_20705 [bacterium]|nr:hypothetical protein [bacterium]
MHATIGRHLRKKTGELGPFVPASIDETHRIGTITGTHGGRCRIEALAELLTAWLGRSDVPDVDLNHEHIGDDVAEGVRAAGDLLSRLLLDTSTAALAPDQMMAAVIADMAAEVAEPTNAATLGLAAQQVADAADAAEVANAMWSAFCPNAVGLRDDWASAVGSLRARRALHAVEPAAEAIKPHQILLTSNVLLAPPLGNTDRLPDIEVSAAAQALVEQPAAFYDHPVPLDTPPARHELVYGLSALDRAIGFERSRGVLSGSVAMLLSVSTTHTALEPVALDHVSRLLGECRLPNLEVFAFAESSSRRLVDEVLGPALQRLGRSSAGVRRVFGTAGPYGRHYSFLKSIAALWSVVVDDRVRATFKVDLDQTLPQQQIVAETGLSAFEQLTLGAWGGRALDANRDEVTLDFIAATLVNEADIAGGLHVPDITDPGPPTRPEHFIFYPALPQAVSTEGEMMPGPDGGARQRVHVTGGTTGATVAGLRRLRPFAPSFWGRAEDQAFALSVEGQEPRPATLHMPGLVMRHDKQSFARDAIDAAAVDKLIGDHERILMFSAYTRLIDPGRSWLETRLAPFTGAYVSRMPVTLAYLHLALTTLSWAAAGRAEAGRLFADGVRRLDAARRFVSLNGRFAEEIEADRQGWKDFHDALDHLDAALVAGKPWANIARQKAQLIVNEARTGGPTIGQGRSE